MFLQIRESLVRSTRPIVRPGCIHIVNGKVVMRLHAQRRIDGPNPLPVTSGPIILQSEGAGIF